MSTSRSRGSTGLPVSFASLLIALCLAGALDAAAAPPPAKPLVPGHSAYTAFAPMGDATAASPYTLSIPIADPQDNTKKKIVKVEVIIPKRAANETLAQASQRKAAAVAAAINAEVAAGNLPATVTATVTTRQIPVWDGTFRIVMDPFGRAIRVPNFKFIPDPNAWGTYRIDGVVAAVSLVKNKAGVVDPTKQGVGANNFTPGVPNPTPSYTPSMSGTGSGSMSSSGVDPTGAQSIVSFGFFDGSNMDNCAGSDISGCPVTFVDGVLPDAGQTESEVLSDLAFVFNLDHQSSGYQLNYNPSTHTLALVGSLSWDYSLFFGNSDTALELTENLVAVPEPETWALLGAGLAWIWCWRRRAPQEKRP
jgi:hypothetical protein